MPWYYVHSFEALFSRTFLVMFVYNVQDPRENESCQSFQSPMLGSILLESGYIREVLKIKVL
jgi:hypothetical protein